MGTHFQQSEIQFPQSSQNSQDPLKLDDLVYSYPTIYDRNVQGIIGSKKEFNELSAPLVQTRVNRGEFLKHQILTQRLLNSIDHLLIMSRTGVGKTGAVVSAAQSYKKAVFSSIVNYAEAHASPETGEKLSEEESYKELLQKGILDHAVSYMEGKILSITKVYFLVKNKFLVDEMSREITEVLTLEDEYHTKHVLKSPTKHTKDLRLKYELGKFYKIMTYIDFVKEVLNIKPEDKLEYNLKQINEQDIKRRFSGCMFIVDEVDSLRSEGEDIELEKEQEFFETGNKKEESYRTLDFAYKVIHTVFHIVERTKQVIMSATPMSDKPYEIAAIMNLILPMNQQMNFPQDSYNSLTFEQLEPYFRGRVSYVREPDSRVDVVYEGSLMNKKVKGHNSQTKTVRLPMSRHQGIYTSPDGYQINLLGQDLAYENAEKKIPSSSSDRRVNPNAFKITLREDSIFTFPDGSGSSGGFNKYINKVSSNDYEAINGFDKFLSNPDRNSFLNWLNVLSVKFAYIFNKVETTFGSSYVFSPFVKIGSIPLSLVFKYQGYKPFLEKNSIFEYNSATGQHTVDKFGRRIIRNNFETNVKRYAVIAKETPKELRRTILETFNSPENIDGSLIKIIIISPVGKTGISLKNVSHIFLLSLWWNETFKYQAISRAIRVMGSTDILNYFQSVSQSKDPIRYPVFVHFLESVRNDGGDTIDSQLYVISEEKDRDIKRIERIMRRCTVDCHIHKKVNQRLDEYGRSTDVDGSQICDYESCTYECSTTLPEEIDYTSYDVIYSGEIIEQIIDIIREKFRYNSVYSMEKFYDAFKMPDGKMQYARKHITAAISTIINDRIMLRDGSGFNHYLHQDGEFLFLQDEYPSVQKEVDDIYSMSIYYDGFYGKQEVDVKKEIIKMQEPNQNRIINEILSMQIMNSADEERIKDLLSELNTTFSSRLIEYILIRKLPANSVITHTEQWLLNFYESNIFRIKEIIPRIIEIGQQRNPAMTPDQIPFMIVVHNLVSVKKTTGHGRAKRHLKESEKLRVLWLYDRLPTMDDWVDANKDELDVFNKIIVATKLEIKENVDAQFNLYGIINKATGDFSLSGNFRQVKETRDDRDQVTERVCKSIHKTELIPILSYLQIEPRYGRQIPPYVTPEQIVQAVEEFAIRNPKGSERSNKPNFVESVNFFNKEPNKKDIAPYYYKWMDILNIPPVNKREKVETVPDMCRLIQQKLSSQDKIIYR